MLFDEGNQQVGLPGRYRTGASLPESDSPAWDVYCSLLSFAANEQSLIWTRYSAFLVAHGFIVGAWGIGSISGLALVMLAIMGIATSGVWYLLNFAGWQNQNRWLHLAAQVARETEFALPTDLWKNSPGKPQGSLYRLAQTLPLAFMTAYTIGLYLGLLKVTSLGWAASVAGAMLIAVALLCFKIGQDALAREIN